MDKTIASNNVRHYADFSRLIEIYIDRFSSDSDLYTVKVDVSNVPLEVAEHFFDAFVNDVLPKTWYESNRK